MGGHRPASPLRSQPQREQKLADKPAPFSPCSSNSPLPSPSNNNGNVVLAPYNNHQSSAGYQPPAFPHPASQQAFSMAAAVPVSESGLQRKTARKKCSGSPALSSPMNNNPFAPYGNSLQTSRYQSQANDGRNNVVPTSQNIQTNNRNSNNNNNNSGGKFLAKDESDTDGKASKMFSRLNVTNRNQSIGDGLIHEELEVGSITTSRPNKIIMPAVQEEEEVDDDPFGLTDQVEPPAKNDIERMDRKPSGKFKKSKNRKPSPSPASSSATSGISNRSHGSANRLEFPKWFHPTEEDQKMWDFLADKKKVQVKRQNAQELKVNSPRKFRSILKEFAVNCGYLIPYTAGEHQMVLHGAIPRRSGLRSRSGSVDMDLNARIRANLGQNPKGEFSKSRNIVDQGWEGNIHRENMHQPSDKVIYRQRVSKRRGSKRNREETPVKWDKNAIRKTGKLKIKVNHNMVVDDDPFGGLLGEEDEFDDQNQIENKINAKPKAIQDMPYRLDTAIMINDTPDKNQKKHSSKNKNNIDIIDGYDFVDPFVPAPQHEGLVHVPSSQSQNSECQFQPKKQKKLKKLGKIGKMISVSPSSTSSSPQTERLFKKRPDMAEVRKFVENINNSANSSGSNSKPGGVRHLIFEHTIGMFNGGWKDCRKRPELNDEIEILSFAPRKSKIKSSTSKQNPNHYDCNTWYRKVVTKVQKRDKEKFVYYTLKAAPNSSSNNKPINLFNEEFAHRWRWPSDSIHHTKLKDGCGAFSTQKSKEYLEATVAGCTQGDFKFQECCYDFWVRVRQKHFWIPRCPMYVCDDLWEFVQARSFVWTHLSNSAFWDGINAGDFCYDEAYLPPALARSIRIAKKRGALHFFPLGVYAAPSTVVDEPGLFSLIMFCPNEVVGSWAGKWLMKHGKGAKQKKYKGPDDDRAKPLEKFGNYEALQMYSLAYSQYDEDHNKEVEALVDPCFGRMGLDWQRLCRENLPFPLMNEPPVNGCANCQSASHINTGESHVVDRYDLRILAGLPVLPNDELFLHYGSEYQRKGYSVGAPCPTSFDMLPQLCEDDETITHNFKRVD